MLHRFKYISIHIYRMSINQYCKDPYFIGRLSGNETRLAQCVHEKNIPGFLIRQLKDGAGINFVNKKDIFDYTNEYISSCINTTTLCHWGNHKNSCMAQQGYFLLQKLMNTYPNKKYIHSRILEPFYEFENKEYEPPFQNLNILIIHSHKETIEKQIQTLDTLFDKPIFVNCTFTLIQPPRQNAGFCDGKSWSYHFNNWKNKLDEELKNHSFDTSLVSAGGFGMITCNYLFTKHKLNTIYVGGGLQLLFGIKGARWNNHPIISNLYNKNWTNVLPNDIPPQKQICENGCYW